MRDATKRQLDHLSLLAVAATGLYGAVYVGGAYALGGYEDATLFEQAVTTLPGNVFLFCVVTWVVIGGGKALLAIRRRYRRSPDNAEGDEVMTALRDGLEEKE